MIKVCNLGSTLVSFFYASLGIKLPPRGKSLLMLDSVTQAHGSNARLTD